MLTVLKILLIVLTFLILAGAAKSVGRYSCGRAVKIFFLPRFLQIYYVTILCQNRTKTSGAKSAAPELGVWWKLPQLPLEARGFGGVAPALGDFAFFFLQK